ncbi:DUF488 family protein [Streptomyces sp. NPDC046197]|uniref:DUF488 family protein n=1 Tax=Streptomyces sp. NPDC046197 TaxID=3154337 RepID=UPI0033C925F7
MAGHHSARPPRPRARPCTAGARVTRGLWSAGHEGRHIGSFVASLLDSRIDVLADVRLAPISRKKCFGEARPAEALAEAGIEYTRLRGLGNPSTTGHPSSSSDQRQQMARQARSPGRPDAADRMTDVLLRADV